MKILSPGAQEMISSTAATAMMILMGLLAVIRFLAVQAWTFSMEDGMMIYWKEETVMTCSTGVVVMTF